MVVVVVGDSHDVGLPRVALQFLPHLLESFKLDFRRREAVALRAECYTRINQYPQPPASTKVARLLTPRLSDASGMTLILSPISHVDELINNPDY